MTKNKFKIGIKTIISIVKTISIILIVVLFIYIGYFLYKNFYQVITKSERVSELQKNIAGETINMGYFDQITTAIKEKMDKKPVSNVNNPFN